MRILVTGSREWTDVRSIAAALHALTEVWPSPLVEPRGPYTLVSGHCPLGADYIAERIARDWRWTVETHEANWQTYGKRAGFVRNSAMVELGADICLAFIKNRSKGATMTADLAVKAGIPTIRYEVTE